MRKRDAERKREVRPTYATVTNEREATPPNVQSRVFANRRTTAHHRRNTRVNGYIVLYGGLCATDLRAVARPARAVRRAVAGQPRPGPGRRIRA